MLIHIFPWSIALVFVSWEVLIVGIPLMPSDCVGLLLTGLYVFYSHFFVLTKYFNKRKYKVYIPYLIGILLTGPFIFMPFSVSSNLDSYIDGQGRVLLFIISSSFVRIMQNLIINTIKKEQLEKQAIETELVYLKSQINPHFMFNTLNNIHTLVYTQAPEAPDAVIRLSSLMRYMIYESNAHTVPLSIEINYLQDYIGLQQLRYKTTPIVDFKMEGDIEACSIAPLLFIHLLENAYKHSPARLEPGSIKVRLAVQQGTLIFNVQNPIGNKRNNFLEERGGIGLINVQKRMQLLYPNQHNLDISKTDKMFKIELKIFNLQIKVHEKKAELLYH